MKVWPLPQLRDGRKPVITSAFKTRNPSRPRHNGVDLFYRRTEDDDPAIGDGAGLEKWVVPPGTVALATEPGVVQRAGNTNTGYRVWVDHGRERGLRTGYYHLANVFVDEGDIVQAGTPLGLVGDNPSDHDARHLHFEVSPRDAYEPLDPESYLEGEPFGRPPSPGVVATAAAVAKMLGVV